MTLEEVHELTHIDPWFLAQIEDIIDHGAGARGDRSLADIGAARTAAT